MPAAALRPPTYEFHVSARARRRYGFDEGLFSLTGRLVLADFAAARRLAQRINLERDAESHPHRAVRAGDLNALGLIDEILHLVVAAYRDKYGAGTLGEALESLTSRLGHDAVDQVMLTFVLEFPPLAVHAGEVDAATYLAGQSGGVPHRHVVLEELLLLWVTTVNPAASPLGELFDDTPLRALSAFGAVVEGLQAFFAGRPPFGPDHQSLVEMLRAPAISVPDSLAGQLEFIRRHWGYLLGETLRRLLAGLDLLREEARISFAHQGPPPVPVADFRGLDEEAERFSPDREWMPRLVVLAKNTYVWLDQLSTLHSRAITRLDEIPEQELEIMAHRGFSGLWLIGLWERSRASRRIKQMMGNPEAVASAYSLYDYDIAGDLGGENAYRTLQARAWRWGIRLACDMVPNHMGIDSRWVMERPHFFIGQEWSPFPAYSFDGPDLSEDSRAAILLEDHYYSRSDAAVVFKRVDRGTGETRYIYHGNDGTGMPWNDTAQLNFLLPEVREAVIQTILRVARLSPVIRFDAAMTLAKRHYHRLWFPEPGSGGDIPSRSEHGLTRSEFDQRIPEEFWREVVDRVAAEAPDTLLLAEAFWLMEGYFVRTLGMHRVYNSAFMNMLRDERNAEYRQLIKNTLEFDPQILKRYVNFMNNPDERTAVDQFGKGDKYFGICTVLATLPGLPMFGHGQVEGFAEKYGMEYRRAYWDEHPDEGMVARHHGEIAPLLHRRYLFADVDHFALYDLYTSEGGVAEDVLAYSNGAGDERALVVYHNRFADVRGWLRLSVAAKGAEGGLRRRHLGDALGLHREEDWFTVLRDRRSGLETLCRSAEIHHHGLFVELGAYTCQVYTDIRELRDGAGHIARLHDRLGGRRVPSVEGALQELVLEPVHLPLRMLVSGPALAWLREAVVREAGVGVPQSLRDELAVKFGHLLGAAADLAGTPPPAPTQAEAAATRLAALLELPARALDAGNAGRHREAAALTRAVRLLDCQPGRWELALARVVLLAPGGSPETAGAARERMALWQLGRVVEAALEAFPDPPRRTGLLDAVLAAEAAWDEALPPRNQAAALAAAMLADPAVRGVLGVNQAGGVWWFHHESMAEAVEWLWITGVSSAETPAEAIRRARSLLALRRAVAASGYRLDLLGH